MQIPNLQQKFKIISNEKKNSFNLKLIYFIIKSIAQNSHRLLYIRHTYINYTKLHFMQILRY